MGKTGGGHLSGKPYEEIGLMFNGNEIKIRVPKSTSKPAKLTSSQLKLQQQCTCEHEGSVCSESCGMPGEIDNGDGSLTPGDRINLDAMNNVKLLGAESGFGQEAPCNVCNVTPKDAPKGVQAQKVLHPDKDVFILKIGKQTDEPNRTGNIEVELVTPRAPAKAQPATHSCKQIQCEDEDIPCCVPCRTCRGVVPKKRKPKKTPCCS